MAIKGLSRPFFGKYTLEANGLVTYASGISGGEAVEYSASIETTEDNPLYADNRIAENDFGTFKSGKISIGTSDLEAAVAKYILNLKAVTRTIGTGEAATTVQETVYDDDAKAVPLGFGIIEEHQINNETVYRAVILCKIVLNIPEDAATTRADKIDWQTKTIEGTIQRSEENSENYKHPWKLDAWFPSEAAAEAYLKAVLGIA